MTTTRKYHQDSYTTRFQARIVEHFPAGEEQQIGLVLDATYFYPSSGGQPHDLGQIQGLPVTDVYIREADQAIVHVVTGQIWQDQVTAEINRERRFDHMQNHTGQHILSQAFLQTSEAETVSFHMSGDSATIDLHTANLSGTQVQQAETLANRVIWQNRPVTARMVPQTEAEQLNVRKLPPINGTHYRLIDIDGFDLTACGGTHVAHTGEVGLLKIIKLEKRREQLRVAFVCGRRALQDYRAKNSIINKLATSFTTSYTELENAVEKQRGELKQVQKQLKKQQGLLLAYEQAHLLHNSKRTGRATIICQAFADRDVNDLRQLARALCTRPGVIVLLGLAGPNAQLVFSRAVDAPGEMGQIIKPALQVLGTAAGGGSSSFAQGGGPPADLDRVQQALERAERLLMAQLK